jgi:hypothetical protein
MNGAELERFNDLKNNVDYTIGGNWNAGLYLLKIVMTDRTVTKKVMKAN